MFAEIFFRCQVLSLYKYFKHIKAHQNKNQRDLCFTDNGIYIYFFFSSFFFFFFLFSIFLFTPPVTFFRPVIP